MNLQTGASRALFIVAIGLSVIFSPSEKADAITDSAFKYSSPQTGYFSIDAMAMISDGNDAADSYFNFWAGGLSTNGAKCFNTGINLPHGAVIQNIKIVYQSGASSDVVVNLLRKRVDTGAPDTFVQQTIADDAATRTSATFNVDATLAKVNNKNYSYGLGICLGSTELFYSAVIQYAYTKAGD